MNIVKNPCVSNHENTEVDGEDYICADCGYTFTQDLKYFPRQNVQIKKTLKRIDTSLHELNRFMKICFEWEVQHNNDDATVQYLISALSFLDEMNNHFEVLYNI